MREVCEARRAALTLTSKSTSQRAGLHNHVNTSIHARIHCQVHVRFIVTPDMMRPVWYTTQSINAPPAAYVDDGQSSSPGCSEPRWRDGDTRMSRSQIITDRLCLHVVNVQRTEAPPSSRLTRHHDQLRRIDLIHISWTAVVIRKLNLSVSRTFCITPFL